jgi:hypothetical protein
VCRLGRTRRRAVVRRSPRIVRSVGRPPSPLGSFDDRPQGRDPVVSPHEDSPAVPESRRCLAVPRRSSMNFASVIRFMLYRSSHRTRMQQHDEHGPRSRSFQIVTHTDACTPSVTSQKPFPCSPTLRLPRCCATSVRQIREFRDDCRMRRTSGARQSHPTRIQRDGARASLP